MAKYASCHDRQLVPIGLEFEWESDHPYLFGIFNYGYDGKWKLHKAVSHYQNVGKFFEEIKEVETWDCDTEFLWTNQWSVVICRRVDEKSN